jgi:hypothetical protein
MATFTADQFAPFVVKLGGATIDKLSHKGDGSATFKAGDLISLAADGTVNLALETDTDTAGAVHGMILEDVDTAVSTQLPILRFAIDTVLAMQVDGAAPSTKAVGTTHLLNRDVAGRYNIGAADAKGPIIVVGAPSDVRGYDPLADSTATNGFLYVSVTSQAVLDSRSA